MLTQKEASEKLKSSKKIGQVKEKHVKKIMSILDAKIHSAILEGRSATRIDFENIFVFSKPSQATILEIIKILENAGYAVESYFDVNTYHQDILGLNIYF